MAAGGHEKLPTYSLAPKLTSKVAPSSQSSPPRPQKKPSPKSSTQANAKTNRPATEITNGSSKNSNQTGSKLVYDNSPKLVQTLIVGKAYYHVDNVLGWGNYWSRTNKYTAEQFAPAKFWSNGWEVTWLNDTQTLEKRGDHFLLFREKVDRYIDDICSVTGINFPHYHPVPDIVLFETDISNKLYKVSSLGGDGYIASPEEYRKSCTAVREVRGKARGQFKLKEQLVGHIKHLNEIRRLYKDAQEQQIVFICVDIECYERSTRDITEVGVSVLIPSSGKGIETRHMRPSENIDKRNGVYVPDHSEEFMFGESVIISIIDLPKIFQELFNTSFHFGKQISGNGPRKIVMVGHNLKSDLDYLRSNKVSIPEELIECDTARMYCALENNPVQRKLEDLCRALGINCAKLHNAGNDAQYTLQAFEILASSPEGWKPKPQITV